MRYEQLQAIAPATFRRYCGVTPKTFTAMVEVLGEGEGKKKKPGRPSKLSFEDKLLLSLSYWREYRTLFHLASSYGLHESTAQHIIIQVEKALISSSKFKLPRKKELALEELVVVLVDSTETPIERPKKSKETITAVRRSATA